MSFRPLPPEARTKSEDESEAQRLAKEGENNRLQAENEQLGKNRAAITATISSEKDRMDAELSDHRDAVAHEHAQLDSQIEQHRKERDAAKNDSETSRQQAEAMHAEHVTLTANVTSARNDVDNLKAEISQKNSELARISGEIATYGPELASLMEKKEVVEKQLTDLTLSLTKKSSELSTTEARREQALRFEDESRKALALMQEEHKSLVSQVQKLNTEVASTTTSLASAKAEEADHRARMAEENETLSRRAAAISLLERNVDFKIEQMKKDGIVKDANALAHEKGL